MTIINFHLVIDLHNYSFIYNIILLISSVEPCKLIFNLLNFFSFFSIFSRTEIARKRPLFDEYLVYTTPNIVPPPNEIAMIVECGGGVYSNNYRKEFPSKFKKIVVSSTADAQLWNKIRIHHPGISIINTEGLMRNVMQQKIDFNGYKLCK